MIIKKDYMGMYYEYSTEAAEQAKNDFGINLEEALKAQIREDILEEIDEYNFSDVEKVKILTFYKECSDFALKMILHKLLLKAGILQIKVWEPGDHIPDFSIKDDFE